MMYYKNILKRKFVVHEAAKSSIFCVGDTTESTTSVHQRLDTKVQQFQEKATESKMNQAFYFSKMLSSPSNSVNVRCSILSFLMGILDPKHLLNVFVMNPYGDVLITLNSSVGAWISFCKS